MTQFFNGGLACVALAIAGANVATNAAAAIVYQDSFSRSGALNGTSPDVVNTGGATWTSSLPGTTTDGIQAKIDKDDQAFLPFTPANGNLYTLTADLDTFATDNHWVALGFGNALVLSKGNGITTDAYIAGNVIESGTASGTTGYSTYKIVLDTTGAFWKVDFFRGNTLEKTIVHDALNPNPANLTVKLFTSGTADANVDNFMLSVQAVPEPGSMALTALAIPFLLCRSRR